MCMDVVVAVVFFWVVYVVVSRGGIVCNATCFGDDEMLKIITHALLKPSLWESEEFMSLYE